MKKIIAAVLVVALTLVLCACGGSSAIKNKLVGVWEVVDTENANATYGLGIEFKKDGTMSYGFSGEMLAGLSDGEYDEDEWGQLMEGMGYLLTIEYKVKSDTVMQITVKALMGLAKESTDVEYSLDGDTLVFDGTTYKRVK